MRTICSFAYKERKYIIFQQIWLSEFQKLSTFSFLSSEENFQSFTHKQNHNNKKYLVMYMHFHYLLRYFVRSLNTDWYAKVHCTSLYLISRRFRIFTFWISDPSCVFLTTYHIGFGFGFSVEQISAIFSQWSQLWSLYWCHLSWLFTPWNGRNKSIWSFIRAYIRSSKYREFGQFR